MAMVRLSKSGIDYLDYAWNFYSGCHNWHNGICAVGEYCWAKRRTERFHHLYPNGFEPTFYPEAFLSPMSLKKPSRIGVCFMGDLFGDWVDPNGSVPVSLYGELDERSIELVKVGLHPAPSYPLRDAVFATIRCCPQHTFLFLTKCPWNLAKWSPFPDNCWVGVTATEGVAYREAIHHLFQMEAKVKFVSFEPLLGPTGVTDLSLGVLDWLIIGAQTKPYRPPKLEWVREIVEAADRAGVPVFLKDNLGWPKYTCDGAIPFYKRHGTRTMDLRQEFPVAAARRGATAAHLAHNQEIGG